jgi:citrate lyase subunit beta / citryl-CoA lyase
VPAIHQSLLFVPANRPERYAKAQASGADAVIVDLEDAVAPTDKSAARDALSDWLAKASATASIVVRINAVQTPWFNDDCKLLADPRIAAIMLPKTESAEDVQAVSHFKSNVAKPIIALIETGFGYANAAAIACAPAVQRLAFGSIDFQLDMGISGETLELLMFRSGLVLASRLAGIAAPLDGVCTSLDDEAAIGQEALAAKRLGFGGKLCIHPKQIAAVNAAFSPTEHELAWAARVIQAAQVANGAAVAVDGKMVDKPVLLRAEALLAQIRN